MAKSRKRLKVNGHTVNKTYDRLRHFVPVFSRDRKTLIVKACTESFTTEKNMLDQKEQPMHDLVVSTGKTFNVEDIPEEVLDALDVVKAFVWTDVLGKAPEFEKSEDL